MPEDVSGHHYDVSIVPWRGSEGGWTVEAIDEDGSIEQAIFLGPNAENRAKRYAAEAYRTSIRR